MSHYRTRTCDFCGREFQDDCNDIFCSDACDERDAERREARETSEQLAACSSCGAQEPLTFSPAHDAHFCERCLDREAGALDGPMLP